MMKNFLLELAHAGLRSTRNGGLEGESSSITAKELAWATTQTHISSAQRSVGRSSEWRSFQAAVDAGSSRAARRAPENKERNVKRDAPGSHGPTWKRTYADIFDRFFAALRGEAEPYRSRLATMLAIIAMKETHGRFSVHARSDWGLTQVNRVRWRDVYGDDIPFGTATEEQQVNMVAEYFARRHRDVADAEPQVLAARMLLDQALPGRFRTHTDTLNGLKSFQNGRSFMLQLAASESKPAYKRLVSAIATKHLFTAEELLTALSAAS